MMGDELNHHYCKQQRWRVFFIKSFSLFSMMSASYESECSVKYLLICWVTPHFLNSFSLSSNLYFMSFSAIHEAFNVEFHLFSSHLPSIRFLNVWEEENNSLLSLHSWAPASRARVCVCLFSFAFSIIIIIIHTWRWDAMPCFFPRECGRNIEYKRKRRSRTCKFSPFFVYDRWNPANSLIFFSLEMNRISEWMWR